MQDFPTTPDPQNGQQGPQAPNPPQPYANQPAYTPPSPYVTPGGQPPQTPPQSNRKKLLIGGGIGCGVLLVLCMCAGLLGALMAQGGTSTASDSPTATAQPGQTQKTAQMPTGTATANPKPTATPNRNAGAPAYAHVISSDGTTLAADMNKVSDKCGSGQDLSGCRAALVSTQSDSESFLADLDAHPAPPCMATVDKPLRAALRDVDSAAQKVIDGIDNYDVGEIDDGSALMSKATSEIDAASSELDKVSCS